MSQFATITEFNTYLSDKLRNVKLNEYFSLIQSQFYSELDISFMDYFLELIPKKDEICVEHQKLLEYGIINTKRSNDIKDCIDKCNAIENIDFLSFAERSAKPKGGRPTINYKLTPKLFKLCLMRSIKENKYANYYLVLEECFYYYQEYQIMYQKVLLSGKDKKLDEMKAQIDELYIIYDYIISKEFYDKVIEYKNQYPECYPLWEMWLNINPYSEDLLLSDINMLWLDVLSLNPKCFKIFEKYKETKYYDSDSDYLNDVVLSANPCIMSYNYFAIKERNQNINEELIKELYSPERISNYLINNESIGDYLN
jgi:hypothetical protein